MITNLPKIEDWRYQLKRYRREYIEADMAATIADAVIKKLEKQINAMHQKVARDKAKAREEIRNAN